MAIFWIYIFPLILCYLFYRNRILEDKKKGLFEKEDYFIDMWFIYLLPFVPIINIFVLFIMIIIEIRENDSVKKLWNKIIRTIYLIKKE